jgi:hypothetical protein
VQWSFQAVAVQPVAVVLTGQGRDGTDRTGSFAGKLCRLFMGPPVDLILQDDDTQTNVAGSNDERDARNTDEGELPAESKPDGGTANHGDNCLDDSTKSDTGQSADLLRSIAEASSQRASTVLVLVEVRNWKNDTLETNTVVVVTNLYSLSCRKIALNESFLNFSVKPAAARLNI